MFDFIFNSLLEKNQIHVYNSASVSKSISNEELLNIGMKIIEIYPFEEMLWRPSIKFTTCFYFYYISTILEQVLPAIFLDALLDFLGKPHKYENKLNFVLFCNIRIYNIIIRVNNIIIIIWYTVINFRRLLPLQQKIYVISRALSYFTLRAWKFENSKFLQLNDKILEIDRNDFDYDFKDEDPTEFLQNAAIGAHKYLFNFDFSKLTNARIIFRR